MSTKQKTRVCEHEWEYQDDDPAAYNDGFNCPTVAVCRKCHIRRDLTKRQNSFEMVSVPILLCSVVVLVVYIIMWITSLFSNVLGSCEENNSYSWTQVLSMGRYHRRNPRTV